MEEATVPDGGRTEAMMLRRGLARTQNCEQDVDPKVGRAANLKEHTQRRQDNCQDNLANVAGVNGQSRISFCLNFSRWCLLAVVIMTP